MRPKYERESDRLEGRKIADLMAANRGLKVIELVRFSELNFILKDEHDTPIIGLETKRRHNKSDRYPTYSVSKRKWDAGIRYCNERRCRFMIGIRYDDGIMAYDVNKIIEMGLPLKAERGGRTDRGDVADVELMMHVSVSYGFWE